MKNLELIRVGDIVANEQGLAYKVFERNLDDVHMVYHDTMNTFTKHMTIYNMKLEGYNIIGHEQEMD